MFLLYDYYYFIDVANDLPGDKMLHKDTTLRSLKRLEKLPDAIF